jgi:predicted nucleic acid-binding protein
MKGNLPIADAAVIADAAQYPPNVSVISKIELLAWNAPTQADADKYLSFVEDSEIFPLTDEVVEKTIEIRRLPKKPKLPDCIIAATAIVNDLTLISRNEVDFSMIPGLAFVNPFEKEVT